MISLKIKQTNTGEFGLDWNDFRPGYILHRMPRLRTTMRNWKALGIVSSTRDAFYSRSAKNTSNLDIKLGG